MSSVQSHRPLLAILLGGCIAATLDISYAFLANGQFGRSPLWVLQFVASGWLGKDAFRMGWTSAPRSRSASGAGPTLDVR